MRARQHWRVAHATGSKAFIDVLKASTQSFADDFLKKVYNARYKNQIPVVHIFSTFADIASIGAKKGRPWTWWWPTRPIACGITGGASFRA